MTRIRSPFPKGAYARGACTEPRVWLRSALRLTTTVEGQRLTESGVGLGRAASAGLAKTFAGVGLRGDVAVAHVKPAVLTRIVKRPAHRQKLKFRYEDAVRERIAASCASTWDLHRTPDAHGEFDVIRPGAPERKTARMPGHEARAIRNEGRLWGVQ